MANVSEDERLALEELVTERVDTLGMTEVARITGKSTTVLRGYIDRGIPEGIRRQTVQALRKLDVPARSGLGQLPDLDVLEDSLAAALEAVRVARHGPGGGVEPGAGRSRDQPEADPGERDKRQSRRAGGRGA